MARLEDSAAPLKDAMGNALLELMQEKPLKKISASDIATRAGLGRVTYFRHFSSKEEVLAYKYQTAWTDFAAHHWYDETDDRANAIALFRFCLRMRQVNELLYAAGQHNVLLATVLDALGSDAPSRKAEPGGGEVPSADSRALNAHHFKAYGLFGLIDTWIRGGYHQSPEDMAAEYVSYLSPEIESLGARGGGRRTGGRAARMRRLQRIREEAARQDPRRYIIDDTP
ncbi:MULTISPECIES: TetR/AcrR family transcriptional regulator [unclassified Actinomyces]|uniref:TetR/AcrR family transcriptional regulator n=2 Tax=Actinomyces TaxID=1654 RepID=UPI00137A5511|nr:MULTISPECIES: TetR/AcrR family transcriptional regulator [unclassified Actinomyces]NDR54812.1 TetR family transcriptional regulator [Actinomyces sp. 565]